MFANMAVSLFEHEIIRTTVPKAKELRRLAEPLITLAKVDSVANRRLAFSRIRDKLAVAKLFSELGPRYENRPGGYTRILKTRARHGDSAPLAFVELVGRQMNTEEFGDFDHETALTPDDDDERVGDIEENRVEADSEASENLEGEDASQAGLANQDADSLSDQETDEDKLR